MKYSKICVIALVGLMLAVFASGTAFAQNTWSGGDESYLGCTSYGTWSSLCSGDPTVTTGSTLTWFNSLENEVTGNPSFYTYPTLKDSINNNQNFAEQDPAYTMYYGDAEDFSPAKNTAPTSPGQYNLEVSNYYGPTQGSTAYPVDSGKSGLYNPHSFTAQVP